MIMRCSLCDYTNEGGSDLTQTPPSHKIKVRWNNLHNEYRCDNCDKSIDTVLDDFRAEDLEKELDKDTLTMSGCD